MRSKELGLSNGFLVVVLWYWVVEVEMCMVGSLLWVEYQSTVDDRSLSW